MTDDLTDAELALIQEHAVKGFTANIARESLEETVKEWEQKHPQQLEVLRESSFAAEQLTPTSEFDMDGDEFVLAPNDSAEILDSFGLSSQLASTAEEFASEYCDNYCDLIQQTYRESTLSKQQFLAYLMSKGEETETAIADALDIEVGTVRSHLGRAQEKMERARATVEVAERCHTNIREASAERGALLES